MLAAYILLALSIIAEVIAASFVTATHGFTNPKPTLIGSKKYVGVACK